MTTVASLEIRSYAVQVDNLPDYPSSVRSGIVGDAAHRKGNSYHNSLEDNPNQSAGSYTNRYFDDMMPAAGSRKHASAIDMSMNTADMIRAWNRFLVVWQNRATDPRAKYIAEFIGWNGVGSAERLDFQSGSRTNASEDHKWHCHEAGRRRYYNSIQAMKARLSVWLGESVFQYLGMGVPSPVTEVKDVSMVHKNVGGNITFAVVTPHGWVEVVPPSGVDEQTFANWLATVTGDSKGYPTAAAYEAAKKWWLDNVVPDDNVMSDAQAQAIAEKVAAAVIASDTNELTEDDLANITEATKQALREGTA